MFGLKPHHILRQIVLYRLEGIYRELYSQCTLSVNRATVPMVEQYTDARLLWGATWVAQAATASTVKGNLPIELP